MSCGLEGLQRVGLLPAAIQREHQLLRHPLTGRIRGHQLAQFADKRGVPASGKIGLNAQLHRDEPLLL